MSGNKRSGNRSGKPRAPGAGRPVRRITFRLGDRLDLRERSEDSWTPPRTVVVQRVAHDRVVFTDGETEIHLTPLPSATL